MKKLLRITSMALAITIMLCTFSMTAFAEGNVSPAAVCPHSTVFITPGRSYIGERSFGGHTWYHENNHTCQDCGLTYAVVHSREFSAHVFSGPPVIISGESGRTCSVCGYFRADGVG